MLRAHSLCGLLLAAGVLSGCGGGSAPTSPSVESPQSTPGMAADAPAGQEPAPAARVEDAPPMIPSISLSSTPAEASAGHAGRAAATKDAEQHRRELLEAMHPLQVMLGQWSGITQREVGDFKALDEPEWIWDFQTDRRQPAMVMTSAGSPYFREVRLTYLPDREIFQLSAKDAEGNVRQFEGTFEEEPEEFQGDDQKTHVKYKLSLTQTNADSPRDQWQITFNQQENHRYLVELARKRGSGFLRFDTVATQRQGTSFARSDADYGERECVISGGLGTIQVSYQGKSYWVCCTGCKAAFEEDPATWIADYEKKQAAKNL